MSLKKIIFHWFTWLHEINVPFRPEIYPFSYNCGRGVNSKNLNIHFHCHIVNVLVGVNTNCTNVVNFVLTN